MERQIDSISPYHAIPALFSAVASFDTPRPAATSAFKVLAVRLSGKVWTDAPGVSASRLALVRAARLVYAERLLGAIRMAWAVQPSGHAEITPERMSFDTETDDLLQASAHALAGGGLMQRFSGDPTKRMHKDPEGFLLGACGVLAGDPPATKRVFAGTFLRALLGASVARGYWAALAARLLLLETARRFAGQVHDDPRGIAILGLSGAGLYGPAAERLTRRDHVLLQREVNACSWERGWLKDVLSSGEESHAFVERPACRITSTRRLFVTSERNIADSITALTETAVGPYSGKRRWALPDRTFERLVSRPFEAITIKLFREHGFVAGEVTAKGAWLTQNGTIQPPAGVPASAGADRRARLASHWLPARRRLQSPPASLQCHGIGQPLEEAAGGRARLPRQDHREHRVGPEVPQRDGQGGAARRHGAHPRPAAAPVAAERPRDGYRLPRPGPQADGRADTSRVGPFPPGPVFPAARLAG